MSSVLLERRLRKLIRAVHACLLWANGAALAQAVVAGHAVDSLDVRVHDRKLDRSILLNTRLVAPAIPPPWQTVVLPSNCTGQDDQFWTLMAPVLVERGYAVVLLDSFSPRGFSSVCTNKFQMWQESRVVDAIAVLKALKGDSRIDPARIALGGHSNGAVTAFMASFTQAAQVVKADALGYAAYFAVAALPAACRRVTSAWHGSGKV